MVVLVEYEIIPKCFHHLFYPMCVVLIHLIVSPCIVCYFFHRFDWFKPVLLLNSTLAKFLVVNRSSKNESDPIHLACVYFPSTTPNLLA